MGDNDTGKRNGYNPYVSTRKAVFNILEQNKDLKPSQIIEILKKDFGVTNPNKQTIRNYKAEWKKGTLCYASPLRPHRRVFEWLVVRSKRRENKALDRGWNIVSNRNQMMVFRGDAGSVHWYPKGKVLLYLRGQAMMSKAKELFCRAFWNVIGKNETLKSVSAPVREIGRHMVFDLGHKLPKFEIRYYEKSHGIRIFSDGTHPTAVEVAETEPFWLNRLDDMADVFSETGESFKESMDRHLSAIGTFEEESKIRNKELIEFMELLKKKLIRRRKRKPRKPKKKSLLKRIRARIPGV